ncbi:hypothetical protein GGE12_005422 [Rhizobium mongolense]|uniref:Uncharacterized protein n=1 Tax=Rhizobium mongolense TaxID=57676 RepID=A0A7W6WHD7_9HYPH|nr:hypothetical protein [Rhizobium mongolense]
MRVTRFADIFERAELHRLKSLIGAVRSTGLTIGYESGFSGMMAMPT